MRLLLINTIPELNQLGSHFFLNKEIFSGSIIAICKAGNTLDRTIHDTTLALKETLERKKFNPAKEIRLVLLTRYENHIPGNMSAMQKADMVLRSLEAIPEISAYIEEWKKMIFIIDTRIQSTRDVPEELDDDHKGVLQEELNIIKERFTAGSKFRIFRYAYPHDNPARNILLCHAALLCLSALRYNNWSHISGTDNTSPVSSISIKDLSSLPQICTLFDNVSELKSSLTEKTKEDGAITLYDAELKIDPPVTRVSNISYTIGVSWDIPWFYHAENDTETGSTISRILKLYGESAEQIKKSFTDKLQLLRELEPTPNEIFSYQSRQAISEKRDNIHQQIETKRKNKPRRDDPVVLLKDLEREVSELKEKYLQILSSLPSRLWTALFWILPVLSMIIFHVIENKLFPGIWQKSLWIAPLCYSLIYGLILTIYILTVRKLALIERATIYKLFSEYLRSLDNYYQSNFIYNKSLVEIGLLTYNDKILEKKSGDIEDICQKEKYVEAFIQDTYNALIAIGLNLPSSITEYNDDKNRKTYFQSLKNELLQINPARHEKCQLPSDDPSEFKYNEDKLYIINK